MRRGRARQLRLGKGSLVEACYDGSSSVMAVPARHDKASWGKTSYGSQGALS